MSTMSAYLSSKFTLCGCIFDMGSINCNEFLWCTGQKLIQTEESCMCEVCLRKEGMVLRRAALARKLEPDRFGATAKSDWVSEENVAKERLIEADQETPKK
ncbi:hypothetical protein BDV36DRAFT_269250 [Aspergillus pseudocaelatus]|uniref:Uncharacterized protein n=1 Tax=Aspergillus pseudocaelatus TaxID=1825620 RepID=A0ABQ6WAI2_9EURO|nr:hypothetical protein BDV36DRAFT_269250 [Aspergillus pseudocaelatus]